jgi:hypothetical protein
MSSFRDTEKVALDFLRGKENPFESLARPQRMDDHFLDLHIPELLAQDRQMLLQIIDRYRVQEYRRAADLPTTRVVTIRGDRGAGKTHLLQSLSYREDGKSQILVRPSYYDMNLPFEEYLLSQLVASLVAEDEVYRSRPIDDIAAALTRRLLRQALLALGPTDRLFALAPGRWKRLRLLLGGGEREGLVFDHLADALQSAGPFEDLNHLIAHHGFKPEQCFRLLQGHLRQYEVGPDLTAVLRRELYSAMARSVLLQDSDPLFRLLEGEYTQIGTPSTTRFEIVSRLLHAVTEACALVRQPIVFAFDNLEYLFSPRNHFDGELTRAFLSSLAQAVDNTKGLLILLFVEKGLFEKVTTHMDEFAQARLTQGVPIYAKGPVFLVDLGPTTSEEMRVLIHSRVQRLLGDFPRAAELPQTFPFDEQFLKQAFTDYQSIRNSLVRLRDEYSRVVYGQTAVKEQPRPVNWERSLESSWNDQLAAAGRKMEGSLVSCLQEIHAGLGSVLQLFLPLSLEEWVLTEVQPTASVGDNPTYGVVSLLHWQHTKAGARAGSNGDVEKVGVGFLLARGNGIPIDLKAKFDFFRRPARGNRLLVLWPTQAEGDNLVEFLPPVTRKVWEESRSRGKTVLRRVDPTDLRALLAFPEWLSSLQNLADGPVPPEVVQAFVKERFQAALHLIAPSVPEAEKVVAHEN